MAVLKLRRADHHLIRMDDEEEVKYWTKHLKVERDVLEQAVEKVGNSAPTVRKELEARAKGREGLPPDHLVRGGTESAK